MEFFIGAVLAIGVGVYAGISGLDKDRAIYPTVTIVIATYYVLYAVMAQSLTARLRAVVAQPIGADR